MQQYQRLNINKDNNNNDDEDNSNPSLTQKQLRIIPGLAELITTPFLLHLAVEGLPDILTRYKAAEITQQHKLTQAALYDVFIERWFNRQVVKLRATGHVQQNEDINPQLWQYCKTLAIKMHQANISHIQYSSAATTAKKGLFGKNKADANPWSAFFNAENAVLRSGCPL